MNYKALYYIIRHTYRYGYDFYRWSKSVDNCDDGGPSNVCDYHRRMIVGLCRDDMKADEYREWEPKGV